MRKVVVHCSRNLYVGVHDLKHKYYRAHEMQQPIYETNLEVSFQWFVSTEFGELVPESRE